jgi:site-specific recombinase XerD
MKANEIKPSMIEAYQHKRLSTISCRGTPFKPASVNRELEVMRRIFNLAVREEMVERNPCWKVTRLSEKNARDRVLSAEELKSLIAHLPQHAADIVTVAYCTGMRAGELFASPGTG